MSSDEEHGDDFYDNEEEYGEEADNDREEGSDDGDKGDGLANTMMSILQQSTKTKVPVLSGRKTKLMKQLEKEKEAFKIAHVKKEEKRRRMKQLMGELPESDDSSTSSFHLDFERQLRKLATKGVVALFNAVAKAKREKVQAEKKEKTASESKDGLNNDDDDDHSVLSFGSLRNLKGVHKRSNAESSAATASSTSEPQTKRSKPGWNVVSSEPVKMSAGWDQEEDDDL